MVSPNLKKEKERSEREKLFNTLIKSDRDAAEQAARDFLASLDSE